MKKLYVLGLLLLLLAAQCAQQKPYTSIQQPASQTDQQLQYLAEVIKMNSDAIDQQEKQFSTDLQLLNGKIDQIIVLQSKVSTLEVKVNTLESKIEAQNQILAQLRSNPAPSDQTKKPAQESNVVTPENLYQQGRQYYVDKDFRKAISTFSDFIKEYPQHDLASNAQYWIGECYYSLDQFETAIFNFDKVVINYPDSNKIVDAKLKIALCLIGMEQYAGALTQLREIQKQYPDYERLDIVRERIVMLENR
ncbi:MAG: tol-pal system protein YbgF [Candidatus Cloacimonetes bacterium]|nr:tol-pal system protein YbgF [Candidatus Cloacimonadota bacterium]